MSIAILVRICRHGIVDLVSLVWKNLFAVMQGSRNVNTWILCLVSAFIIIWDSSPSPSFALLTCDEWLFEYHAPDNLDDKEGDASVCTERPVTLTTLNRLDMTPRTSRWKCRILDYR